MTGYLKGIVMCAPWEYCCDCLHLFLSACIFIYHVDSTEILTLPWMSIRIGWMAGQLSIPVTLDLIFLLKKSIGFQGKVIQSKLCLLWSLLMGIIKLNRQSCISLNVCRRIFMMSRRIEDLSILPFTDEWYNIMHFKNSRLCSLSLTGAWCHYSLYF